MSARIEYDLLLVGGSPSNLTLAYHFLELAKESGKEFTIAILEKGKEFGSHIMSGAVSKPHVLEKVLPNYKELGFPIEAICTESNFSVLGTQKKWDMPAKLYPEVSGQNRLSGSDLEPCHQLDGRNRCRKRPKKCRMSQSICSPASAAHGVVFEDGRVAGVQVSEEPKSEDDYVYAQVHLLSATKALFLVT